MSITRSLNLLSQQRLDVSTFKQMESSVNYDFDLLAGISLAGKVPVVFRGLILNTSNAIASSPSTLTLRVANSVIWHYLASESGTVYQIGTDEPDQVLSTSNSNVSGSFSSGTNYIGLDLYKTPDSTTSDTVSFLDADSSSEFSQTVPLARTIKYRIVITTQPFSVMTHLVPIAKVFVTNGNVVTITDARQMMFRLGSGGDSPNASSYYSWGSRTENAITTGSNASGSPFSGEDKSIESLRAWTQAIMTSIWEIRGGTKWYSPHEKAHVKLAYRQPVLNNGDNIWFLNGVALTSLVRAGSTVTVTLTAHPFTIGSTFELNSGNPTNFPSGVKTVTATPTANTFQYTEAGVATTATGTSYVINTVAWSGLVLLYENSNDSSIYKNTINNKTIVIPDKYAVYADLERAASVNIDLAVKPLYDLGFSAIPGRRTIICWREGSEVFSKDRPYEVGRTFQAATTAALGLVRLNKTPDSALSPRVVSIMADGKIEVDGQTTSSSVYTAKFTALADSVTGIGNTAVYAEGGDAASPVVGAGSGIVAVGGDRSVGGDAGVGIYGLGGNGGGAYSTSGAGGAFFGGSGGKGVGVVGGGYRSVYSAITPISSTWHNAGGVFRGGDSDGAGAVGQGGGTNGAGILGYGVGSGSGINGYTDTAGSAGVAAINGISQKTAGGIGVWGVGTETYEGIRGWGGNDTIGVNGGNGVTGLGGTSSVSGGNGISGTGGASVGDAGAGVKGTGGSSAGGNAGPGVIGFGGNATGGGTPGVGVAGYGAGTSGTGVLGVGAGYGVKGQSTSLSAGIGGLFTGSGTGRGVEVDYGDIGLPNTNVVEYTSSKTGVVILSMLEFTKYSGTATLNPPDVGFALPHYLLNNAAGTNRFAAQIRLPRGAVITDVELLNKVTGGGGSIVNRPTIRLVRYDTSVAPPYDVIDISSGGTFTLPATPVTGSWTSIGGVIGTTPVTNGLSGNDNSSMLTLDWNVTFTGSDAAIVGAWRITYTYTTIDFMV